MRVIARTFFFTTGVFLAAGCHAPPTPTGPTVMVLRIPDRDVLINETLTLLREQDFAPQWVDRQAGRVVTRPSTGQQWFEFWRGDSIGPYQLFESSIHTVRRIVNVEIDPADVGTPGEDFRVSVRVEKERYSAPERQVTTASGALAIYSERLPTTEGLMASKARGEHWVPLGRDLLLERHLLDKIAGVSTKAQPVDSEGEPPNVSQGA